MYRNVTFGSVKAVLFIEVSSLQGVLIRGATLYSVLYDQSLPGEHLVC